MFRKELNIQRLTDSCDHSGRKIEGPTELPLVASLVWNALDDRCLNHFHRKPKIKSTSKTS